MLFDANALTSAEDAESGEGKGLSRLHSNPAIAALSVPAKVNIILEERLDVVVLDCEFIGDDPVLLLPTCTDCCPCGPCSVELLPSITEVMDVSGGVRLVPGFPVN